MPDTFDPYHKWLGIRPKDQPPNHYRLLGVEPFEHDPDVVEAAADQRMAHVRTYQTGPHSAISQRLLNELNTSELRVTRPDGTLATVRVKPLDARRWYTLRFMVTREATTVWVDGEEVFSEKRDNPEFTPAPISVYSATGSIVDVKRFVVKPLE